MKLKRIKTFLLALSIATTLGITFTSCKGEDKSGNNNKTDSTTTDNAATSETWGDLNGEGKYTNLEPHSYSKGIDDNGYWEGVDASEYVTPFTYDGLEIPRDSHEVTNEKIEEYIESVFIRKMPSKELVDSLGKITDREIVSGDLVNLDYVGSIDGEEFDGGNSKANDNNDGLFVTAGAQDQFIDDFLDQIIGHKPGETFDVNVTFPEEYPNATELQGKDAVFVVTLNFMLDKTELYPKAEEDLKDQGIMNYVLDYISEDVEVTIPDSLMELAEKNMVEELNDLSIERGMTMNEYTAEILEIEGGVDGLLEKYKETNTENIHVGLVLQYVAQEKDFKVTDEMMEESLKSNGYTDEAIETNLENYGKPFMKQYVLQYYNVLDFIIDNAKYL